MRFIDRSNASKPKLLSSKQARDAQDELVRHFQTESLERERKRAPFNPNLWLDQSVSIELDDVFKQKCAFCEQRFSIPGKTEVHHFRPLGNAQQINGKSQDADYYGWFAYEWRNLYLACPACHTSKSSFFPVTGLRAPLLCSWEEARDEERIGLVDPCLEKPWKHFEFERNGYAIGKTKTGANSILVFSLNRVELIESRRNAFDFCFGALADLKSFNSDARELGRIQVLEILSEDAPHSGALSILLFRVFVEFSKEMEFPVFPRKQLFRGIESVANRLTELEWSELLDKFSTSPYVERQLEVVSGPSERPWRNSLSGVSQIRRLRINNFKGIKHIDLKFQDGESGDWGVPCAMLLGENSTGKSSILQAIALCLMSESMRRRLSLRPVDFLPRGVGGWQYSGTVNATIEIDFDVGESRSLTINATDLTFVSDIQDQDLVVLAYGARRFFGDQRKRVSSLSGLRSLFDPVATLNHPKTYLDRISEEEFSVVARAMREILALREKDRIMRGPDQRVYVDAHGRQTPVDRLSDGYKSLFSMAIDVIREMVQNWGNLENARGIVLIDEVETHLHPRWKMRVMIALRRSMPQVQFISTSHDPLCLRGMRNNEVHVLIRRPDEEIEELTELPDVRGLRAEQLLTSDYFGLSSTADSDVELGLEELSIAMSNPQVHKNFLQQARLKVLPLSLSGETPQDQIINEAIARYVAERRSAPTPRRNQVREEAVKAVLHRLQSFQLPEQR